MSGAAENLYTPEFFARERQYARRSAETVVPIIVELTGPANVVDVGCGTGTWLAVFERHGVKDVLGVDGDYVDRDALEIDPARFVAHDLAVPLELARRFDLVVSLEVAEHLRADRAATFIESLTDLGPVVLFSAAVPGQGGTDHVNEQWPAYWAELFAHRGYVHVDCLRRRLWHDQSVAYWYAQNVLVYVAADELPRHERLAHFYGSGEAVPPALVHPKRYLEWVEWATEHDCGMSSAGSPES